MSEVKPWRWKIENQHVHRDWPPGHMEYVLASDYDALRKAVVELVACKDHAATLTDEEVQKFYEGSDFTKRCDAAWSSILAIVRPAP